MPLEVVLTESHEINGESCSPWTLSSGRVECVDCCNVLAVEAVSETSIAYGRNVLAKEPVLGISIACVRNRINEKQ